MLSRLSPSLGTEIDLTTLLELRCRVDRVVVPVSLIGATRRYFLAPIASGGTEVPIDIAVVGVGAAS